MRGSLAGFVRPLATVGLAFSAAACGGSGNARVTVPSGASLRLAADSLEAAGVIGSAKLFSVYAKVTGRDRSIKAGTYILDRRASWDEIVDALVAGKGIVLTLTIPEGWDVKTIIPAISRVMNVPTASLDSAVRDSALLRRLNVPIPTL